MYALHTKLALVIFGCRENTEGESRMLKVLGETLHNAH